MRRRSQEPAPKVPPLPDRLHMAEGGQHSARAKELLRPYPKKRPALPAEYRALYDEQYVSNREGRTLAARITAHLESWMHKQIARAGPAFPMLEIGAGTLNHVAYEAAEGAYDVVEPYELLYRGKPELKRIRNLYGSIDEVPMAAQYERIISIAVLEHILDLPALVAKCALLLAPNGRFLAGIPSEGALLWYLAWRFGTGAAWALRTGLDYGVLMRYEHVNTAAEILRVLGALFDRLRIRRFPTPWFHTSFYTFIEANGADRELAAVVLAQSKAHSKESTRAE